MHKSLNSLTRFLSGGFYQAAKGRDFPMHQHLHWEFVYYLAGSVECVQEKRRFTCRPGTLWLTPPHTQHAEIARSAYHNIYLTLQAPPDAAWPAVVVDDPDRNLERLCRSILQELRLEKKRDEILLHLMTQELVRRVVTSSQPDQAVSGAELVRRAEALFFASLDQPLTIAGTARRIGASTSNLRRAFQRIRGESPRECLCRLRCQQALHWLQNSTHSLEAIADLSGFDSASHLSRVMLKQMGQRPGKLRK